MLEKWYRAVRDARKLKPVEGEAVGSILDALADWMISSVSCVLYKKSRNHIQTKVENNDDVKAIFRDIIGVSLK